MRRIKIRLYKFTLLLFISGLPGEPSGSGVKANGQPAAQTGAPIDGGVSLLIVATAAYTSRKLAKMKATKKAVI